MPGKCINYKCHCHTGPFSFVPFFEHDPLIPEWCCNECGRHDDGSLPDKVDIIDEELKNALHKQN